MLKESDNEIAKKIFNLNFKMEFKHAVDLRFLTAIDPYLVKHLWHIARNRGDLLSIISNYSITTAFEKNYEDVKEVNYYCYKLLSLFDNSSSTSSTNMSSYYSKQVKQFVEELKDEKVKHQYLVEIFNWVRLFWRPIYSNIYRTDTMSITEQNMIDTEYMHHKPVFSYHHKLLNETTLNPSVKINLYDSKQFNQLLKIFEDDYYMTQSINTYMQLMDHIFFNKPSNVNLSETIFPLVVNDFLLDVM
jgi:hypothetical protein